MRVALVLAFAGWVGCETRLGNMQQADPVCGVPIRKAAGIGVAGARRPGPGGLFV